MEEYYITNISLNFTRVLHSYISQFAENLGAHALTFF